MSTATFQGGWLIQSQCPTLDWSMALTDTETKILLCLVQKQTMDELNRTSGISFSYLQKKVGSLKNRGYITSVGKKGQSYLYQTVRLPETERLFSLRATASANGNVYRIPEFYGQHVTFPEAYNYTANKRKSLPGHDKPLFAIILTAISVLKVRSYKKHIGENAIQHPHEDEMRKILWEHIVQTEKELKLARELYETDFIWSGHSNIWQVLSEKEPSPNTLVQYEGARKLV